jgi:hypothetical protein
MELLAVVGARRELTVAQPHPLGRCQQRALGKVDELVERGADLSIKEDLYHATAADAANFFGQIAVREYLRSC